MLNRETVQIRLPSCIGRHGFLALALIVSALFPPSVCAIPAFARKHNVKCYNCHHIPPVLNKTGYIFKRLGYRLPPDEMERGGSIPKVGQLDRSRWNLGDAVALAVKGSASLEKRRGEIQESKSELNLDSALLFTGGALPQTNFFYFGEYALQEDGESGLEQAYAGYVGGRANSSFFIKAGQMFVLEGEGTRAANLFSHFPESSPVLSRSGPLHFSLDQNPVGAAAGYTWASSYFKQVVAFTVKVTNGVNEEGEAIQFDSPKKSKDIWADADWWFGPDGGISAMVYYGRKDQARHEGEPEEFVFHPHVRRYGVFANYLFFNRLDIQAGFMRGQDDWQQEAGGRLGNLVTNGYRGEIDFYPIRGVALFGRYDRFHLHSSLGGSARATSYGAGIQTALTQTGNVVLRATYMADRNPDLWQAPLQNDKRFSLDFRFMW
jgi:hypothetical protein